MYNTFLEKAEHVASVHPEKVLQELPNIAAVARSFGGAVGRGLKDDS